MKPRITIEMTANGELEIYLNEAGRNLLVDELKHLSEKSDHFHLGFAGMSEVEISSRPYGADTQIVETGKVLFRTDAWDKQYFPHVLDSEET